MTGWTAIVPIKAPAERKSRLCTCLSDVERITLSEVMLERVLNTLARAPSVGRIAVLAPVARARTVWFRDQGRGLNGELSAAAVAVPNRLLVIHADLPGLSVADVEALTAAAAAGGAIAPDRYLRGTNALAIPTTAGFAFQFGPESLERHTRASWRSTVVRRPGLACDVDQPDELAAAIEAGHLSESWLGDSGQRG